jgi:hypothetical protein
MTMIDVVVFLSIEISFDDLFVGYERKKKKMIVEREKEVWYKRKKKYVNID